MNNESSGQQPPAVLPTSSALANVLRTSMAVFFLVSLVLAVLIWSWSRAWAIGLVASVLVFTPVLVAIEVLVLYVVNRGPLAAAMASRVGLPAPPLAGVLDLVKVGWAESVISTKVFGLWQAHLWRSEPDVLPDNAVGRTGVVFVHGYFCNRGLWLPHLREMRRLGVPAIAVNLEPVFGGIDAYAPIIEAAVARLTALTGQAPVIVGHSMGGLAARAWLCTTDLSRVKQIVTIGTPHHGTWTAQWSHARNGQQMKLDSQWLTQLAQKEAHDSTVRHAKFVCVYSAADNIVFPAGSATLLNATNVHLPALGHVEMTYVDASMRVIEQALGQHLG